MNCFRFVAERDQAFKIVLGILCYHIPCTKFCKKLLYLAEQADFLFSAHTNFVALNLEGQDWCHLNLGLIKVAFMPFPSSRWRKSIGIGSSFSSLNLMILDIKVENPLPVPTSRRLESAEHFNNSYVTF